MKLHGLTAMVSICSSAELKSAQSRRFKSHSSTALQPWSSAKADKTKTVMTKTHQDGNHRQETGFSAGLFWGALLGAVGMFLFATKKGQKLQQFLREHGERALEEIEEIYEEAEASRKDGEAEELPKLESETGPKTKTIGHIAKLQERGRKVARYFTRAGKVLK